MELSDKIQKLRKERGLTQEQLANQLFVSRTAVSKWETGRGVPSIESLQMITKLYGITLDELLSTEEVIRIAETENKENIANLTSYIDGIFNVFAVMGLILPIYKVSEGGAFYSVPLYRYGGWLAIFYWVLTVAMIICGCIQLVINKTEHIKLNSALSIVGLILNASGILLLILSSQPYPAVMFFVLLILKCTVVITKKK